MKKNNYLLPFSILFALGLVNKSNAQVALKANAATTADTKASITPAFMALEGRITDAEGTGIGFATMSLKGTGKTIQSDAYGCYRLNELQPGTYTIIVSKEGFADSEMQITIEMPKIKAEQSKIYSTPNSKSINASPVIKDILMKRSSV